MAKKKAEPKTKKKAAPKKKIKKAIPIKTIPVHELNVQHRASQKAMKEAEAARDPEQIIVELEETIVSLEDELAVLTSEKTEDSKEPTE